MVSALQSAAIRQKVDALLSKMNLDQKVGQMILAERMSVTPEDVRNYHLGGVLSGSGSWPGDNRPSDWVAMNDAFWVASMHADEQHLAIPLIYGTDAVHGNNNVRGATLFPHNIGLGAADDPGLIRRIAAITASEVLACGVEWVFAPCLAVAQDLHWGRSYESCSEDPALVTAYAREYVLGFQNNPNAINVLACAKHWVGDGGTTHGINQGDTSLAKAELERIHMMPFEAAIMAGVFTIMASFNSWNGKKCHGHKHLLTDVLKNSKRFDGYVVSDFDGIEYLSEDYHEAVAMAVNAGIDMFMVSEPWKDFVGHVKQHVKRGSIAMQRINDAVRRILTVKFASGLFDQPSPANRFWSNNESFGGREHRLLAREAVRKSLVLLKNDNSVLPLNKNARILVAGKNADNRGHQCGGFSISWQGGSGNDLIEKGTSIWEGIRGLAPNAVLSNDSTSADADPGQYDVAIVVIGETPYAEGMGDIRNGDHIIVEAGSQIAGSMNILEPYGNTLELSKLHPEDIDTITTISRKNIPVVVVLVSGRPLVVGPELDKSTAFVAAWLPGSEGQGVADVLFGDFDFQGKLPFSWPAVDNHLYTRSQNKPEPQFPLGYGLTYKEKELIGVG